ncbi:hypothetical protein ACJO5Y_07625 [Marinobacter sp. GN3S48]|uniref:hypothetical protein n=1 Tax=Marinobacter sp. GN3S48 TaxID=3382302 RepID=UPI00387B1995
MEIGKVYKEVLVNELGITRMSDGYKITLELQSSEGDQAIQLLGVREVDNLAELLEAERLWVQEDEGSQVEFGRYQLCVSGETYTEIVCDEVTTNS